MFQYQMVVSSFQCNIELNTQIGVSFISVDAKSVCLASPSEQNTDGQVPRLKIQSSVVFPPELNFFRSQIYLFFVLKIYHF
jgi:hypothetical protein